jgi:hypothetical protein
MKRVAPVEKHKVFVQADCIKSRGSALTSHQEARAT